MISIKIDNQNYTFKENMTILECLKELNINVPTLCFLKEINEVASCRMCVVEVNGRLLTACTTKISENMNILTNSKKVISSRKNTLKLLLENHNKSCLTCKRNTNCDLQKYASLYNIEILPKKIENDITDCGVFIRDNSKCILCNKCVSYCDKIQSLNAIARINRGIATKIEIFDEINNTCIKCGGCVGVCPTGALHEKENIDNVIELLQNKENHVVVMYAPAVRATLGESFDLGMGKNVTNKLNEALKIIGFTKVFDVTAGADFTVYEESLELIERIKNNKKLPMFTSCCPAWVNYVTKIHPELKDNLSSCKSPQNMLGALIKTYYSKTYNIKLENIKVISIMPCIAKKDEITSRDNATKYSDVDYVLTTKEILKMIKMYGISFKDLKGITFDKPFNVGNSIIFGTTGGVMECALRFTAKELNKEKFSCKELLNSKNLKEMEYNINGTTIKVAVVYGIKTISDLIKTNEYKKYHFIEVMNCINGCINGPGNPYIDPLTRSYSNYKQSRAKVLTTIESNIKNNSVKSNPALKTVYKNFLTNENIRHKILHTKYK